MLLKKYSLDPNIREEDHIQKVIDAGLIPKLVEFMNKDGELQLQVFFIENFPSANMTSRKHYGHWLA